MIRVTSRAKSTSKVFAVALAISMATAGFAPNTAHGQTIKELDDAIATVEESIKGKEDTVSQAQERLTATIRDAYKNGDLDPNSEIELVMSADNLSELITNAEYLESISDKYVASISSAQEALNSLTDAKDTLVELRELREAQIKARENADTMHFCQWGESWSDVRYYCGTIGNAGCGLCSYTVAINILKGTDYTPDTMLPVCGDWQGLIHYPKDTTGTPDGTSHAEWTKSYFDVDMESIGNSVSEIRDALSDGESVVIALARGYSFKSKSGAWRYTGGHYVCIYRCDDKGFYVQDSALKGDDGTAVYYTDADMKTMLDTGTFVKLSN